MAPVLSLALVTGTLSSAGAESAPVPRCPRRARGRHHVAPAASIAAGQTQQFTATGTYPDLSTKNLTDSVTWSTSKAATATISNAAGSQGLATGVATGAVTITATDPSTLIPGTAALTVADGIPTPTISISPPSGARRTPVAVSGSGFTVGQTISIIYMSGRKRPRRGTSVLCTTTVAIDGTFTCNGAIPKRRKAGGRAQKAVMGRTSGGTVASTVFKLT